MILFEQMEIPDFIKQNERHINKLKEDYIQFKKYKKDYDGNLNEKNYQDVQTTIDIIIDTIIKEVDPTYNNKSGKANVYQSWILQTFAKQNKQGLQKFDEDLQKYKNCLVKYVTYLEEIKLDSTKNIDINNLKIINTQINKYDNIFDLLDQLSKYEQKHSKQINVSQYSNIPDKIFDLVKTGEILLVQELKKYMIFIPLTEQQQRLVGKDTEWCTQYQHRDTLFYDYNQYPIFSIRSKNIYKDNYQFYFSKSDSQYKNNEDQTIDFESFNLDHLDILNFFCNFQIHNLVAPQRLKSKNIIDSVYNNSESDSKNKKSLQWKISTNISEAILYNKYIFQYYCKINNKINPKIIIDSIKFSFENIQVLPAHYLTKGFLLQNKNELITFEELLSVVTKIGYLLDESIIINWICTKTYYREVILGENNYTSNVDEIINLFKMLKPISKESQLQIITFNPYLFKFLKYNLNRDPDEDIQIMALKNKSNIGYIFKFIDNPSNRICQIALTLSSANIVFIVKKFFNNQEILFNLIKYYNLVTTVDDNAKKRLVEYYLDHFLPENSHKITKTESEQIQYIFYNSNISKQYIKDWEQYNSNWNHEDRKETIIVRTFISNRLEIFLDFLKTAKLKNEFNLNNSIINESFNKIMIIN